MSQAGFVVNDVTLEAISIVGEVEGGGVLKRTFTRLPKRVWRMFAPLMPTLIFVCRRPDR